MSLPVRKRLARLGLVVMAAVCAQQVIMHEPWMWMCVLGAVLGYLCLLVSPHDYGPVSYLYPIALVLCLIFKSNWLYDTSVVCLYLAIAQSLPSTFHLIYSYQRCALSVVWCVLLCGCLGVCLCCPVLPALQVIAYAMVIASHTYAVYYKRRVDKRLDAALNTHNKGAINNG